MLKLLKKRLKNEKGLTLIEVLAVVVILAIVAMIAIPAIGNLIENNRIKAIKADAINVISAAQIYYTDGGEEKFGEKIGNTTKIKGEDYVQNFGSISKDGLTVTRDGKISATGTKGNVTIKFGNESSGASIEDIKAEEAKAGSNIEIRVDGSKIYPN
ncbi:type II secretion system protein [Ureibacillus thermosphaericus]|uniref:type II secretion system protein n=1 Tax=Ureibacillus thermosphaericus TaxID=51173 RepID=UPI000BBCCF55|nr:prepilin-type N-terminal cleavage/methylation domain-containing protein [Ureibacillus thermosphaericus]